MPLSTLFTPARLTYREAPDDTSRSIMNELANERGAEGKRDVLKQIARIRSQADRQHLAPFLTVKDDVDTLGSLAKSLLSAHGKKLDWKTPIPVQYQDTDRIPKKLGGQTTFTLTDAPPIHVGQKIAYIEGAIVVLPRTATPQKTSLTGTPRADSTADDPLPFSPPPPKRKPTPPPTEKVKAEAADTPDNPALNALSTALASSMAQLEAFTSRIATQTAPIDSVSIVEAGPFLRLNFSFNGAEPEVITIPQNHQESVRALYKSNADNTALFRALTTAFKNIDKK